MSYIYNYYYSPIGLLEIKIKADRIAGLSYVEKQNFPANEHLLTDKIIQQLDGYFAGELQRFDLPLLLEGTNFQKTVWQALIEIPYGVTATYKDIAVKINKPGAMRAVGYANHKNPVIIIVPCHRVIGAGGKLVGYGGGLWRKEWLLKHEKVLFL